MKHYVLLLTLFILNGCTNSTNMMSDTVASAFFPNNGQSITAQTIASIPYSSLKISLESKHETLVILGEVEQVKEQPALLKWVSSENEMIVTQAGRIVKTVGLKQGNLLSTQASEIDPLIQNYTNLNQLSGQRWNFQLSWQPGNYTAIPAQAAFTVLGSRKITPWAQTINTTLVREDVYIPLLNFRYSNLYWFNSLGDIIQSEQQLYPGSLKLKLNIGRPYISSEPNQ